MRLGLLCYVLWACTGVCAPHGCALPGWTASRSCCRQQHVKRLTQRPCTGSALSTQQGTLETNAGQRGREMSTSTAVRCGAHCGPGLPGLVKHLIEGANNTACFNLTLTTSCSWRCCLPARCLAACLKLPALLRYTTCKHSEYLDSNVTELDVCDSGAGQSGAHSPGLCSVTSTACSQLATEPAWCFLSV